MAERPLFDPWRIEVPEQERGPAPTIPLTLSVRQVNELVRGAIARHLPATLHVLGEIGDLSRAGSGHLYFTLKDRYSELRCVMWRSTAGRLRFEPQAGMEVIATGSIEVYAPRGRYQLLVQKLEPRGVGALEVAFRQLKEKLQREGLFAAGRKKPLPRIPARVALVTSPSGAAIRDILQTLGRRFRPLEILVFPVRVQGEGAAGQIAGAIRLLNEQAEALGGIDVAIVGRGGGSLEDLWAFNEEVVARAIAASRVPIVSAVGHEVDVTISDLVADARAATPTAAAELISPQASDLLEAIERQAARARRSALHGLELARARLRTRLAYDGLARPLRRLRERGQLLDEMQQRLRQTAFELFRRTRRRLDRAELVALRFGSGAQFVRAANQLSQRVHRLERALDRLSDRAARRLVARQGRLEKALPTLLIGRYGERLRQAAQRLDLVAGAAVRQRRRLLEVRLEAVAACDPRRVLARGYSITRGAADRRLIRSLRQVRGGMRIITELSDGQFPSTAEDPRQAGLFD